jgi:hypothetical protein
MKKLLFILTAFCLFSNIIFAENCEIINHYGDFIRIEKKKYEDEEYLTWKIVKPNYEFCFAELFENTDYVEYLLMIFPAGKVYEEMDELMKSGADSSILQNNFIQKLQKDSSFNAVMSELVQKSIDKKIPKDTISMDYFFNILVKFFEVTQIQNDKYSVKICIGNGIENTEIERNPQVEAFAYSLVFTKLPEAQDILLKTGAELYKINLGIGINNEEAVLRAQGALYFLLRNNQNFKDFYANEYEANKELLPFVIVE